MRFFIVACLLGILVASIGCMTENWSTPLFRRNASDEAPGKGSGDLELFSDRVMERELFGTGMDPRARDIERRLGFKDRE